MGDQGILGGRIHALTDYLSNHYEIFFISFFVFFGFFLFVSIALKLREISLAKVLRSTFRYILLFFVVFGLLTMAGLSIYLYWYNYYREGPEMEFPGDVLASTDWVRSSLPIYFIDGSRLYSIRINGRDKWEVLSAPHPIKEYVFSPDGKSLLVSTGLELYLVNEDTHKAQTIDTVREAESSDELKGTISGLRWAPDSRKFCYELARWSSYSSQDKIYVYNVRGNSKRAIQTPTRRISSLYWDQQAANLYYLQQEAQDTSIHTFAFEVKVFRIPLATLNPELVTAIPKQQAQVPIENLNLRGINLFLAGKKLDFVQGHSQSRLVSEKGVALGIDDQDHLYYVPHSWFHKRLFKVARGPALSDISRYQYNGGDLLLQEIRWIPGGRYVIMLHRYFGVLVMEPTTRKVGLLIGVHGDTIGWYEALRN